MLHHSDQPITGTILVADDQAAHLLDLERTLRQVQFSNLLKKKHSASAMQD